MSNTDYPTPKECMRILKEEGCTKRVMIHCATVRAVAERISSRIPDANPRLVTDGAILHDVGRSQTHSIMHAVIGANIAEKRGLPGDLVEIIRRHTGAGIDPDEAEEMGLPPGDYIPRTIEQKIVAHADNLVSDNTVVTVSHSFNKLERKGAHRGAARLMDLHRELSDLYGEDLDCMVDVLGEHPRLKGVYRRRPPPKGPRHPSRL